MTTLSDGAPGVKPAWIRVRSGSGDGREFVERSLSRLSLRTVCEEASCPNLGECFSRKTATFMILGRQCTRRCAFCAVSKGKPEPVDPDEPAKVAEAVLELGLTYAVITSVTRDDLADGGASHFASCVRELRDRVPGIRVEILTPDFRGDPAALQTVVEARPDVLNHNVETVPRLYASVRPGAEYGRSIGFLREARRLDPRLVTKSGMMLGLGERIDEVLAVMEDLHSAGCSLLTLGQYLSPSKAHHPVAEYVRPETFEALRAEGLRMGFAYVASGPLVRSSYGADRAFEARNAVRGL